MLLTAVMMVAELIAGWVFGSMALLADGWHMASHAAALGVALFTYAYARRHQDDPSFSFGTGKVLSLGGFGSAVALFVVALAMGAESTHRFFEGAEIRFDEALLVAGLGLIVNLASAWLLRDEHHGHGHGHGHGHDHGHGHATRRGDTDHNLRAAYMHVLADALTSVLAIAALLAGKMLGWSFLDPMMGIVGMLIIGHWALGLMRESAGVLLDRERPDVAEQVRTRIEARGDARVCDLHVWSVAPGHEAALVAVVTQDPQTPEHYKRLLHDIEDFAHVTVEVNPTGPPRP